MSKIIPIKAKIYYRIALVLGRIYRPIERLGGWFFGKFLDAVNEANRGK